MTKKVSLCIATKHSSPSLRHRHRHHPVSPLAPASSHISTSHPLSEGCTVTQSARNKSKSKRKISFSVKQPTTTSPKGGTHPFFARFLSASAALSLSRAARREALALPLPLPPDPDPGAKGVLARTEIGRWNGLLLLLPLPLPLPLLVEDKGAAAAAARRGITGDNLGG